MNAGTRINVSYAKAYLCGEKKYKGKNPHLKCQHCKSIGHVNDHCWILHPELKPDFMKSDKGFMKKPQYSAYKDNYVSSSSTKGLEALPNFVVNPTILINELIAYIQMKKNAFGSSEPPNPKNGNSIALLGKFAGFLANMENLTQNNIQGILTALKTTININQMHDLGS